MKYDAMKTTMGLWASALVMLLGLGCGDVDSWNEQDENFSVGDTIATGRRRCIAARPSKLCDCPPLTRFSIVLISTQL